MNYYLDNEITFKDYLRVKAKHPDDKIIMFKVLCKDGNWNNYNSVEEVDFEKAIKVILVFKKHNPMFVRTLDDEFAMEQVNRFKKKYQNNKFIKR